MKLCTKYTFSTWHHTYATLHELIGWFTNQILDVTFFQFPNRFVDLYDPPILATDHPEI